MKDTVEEKIMALQEKKLKLADGVLTGAKRTPGGNKLTMQELTSLFSITWFSLSSVLFFSTAVIAVGGMILSLRQRGSLE